MIRLKHIFTFVLLILILPAALCSGQIDRANLKGTLTDPSGALVAGATVSVLYPQTDFRQSVVSTRAGDYTFSGLPLGTCNVTVTAPGFRNEGVEGGRAASWPSKDSGYPTRA